MSVDIHRAGEKVSVLGWRNIHAKHKAYVVGAYVM